jgi:hypothetical protein
VHAGIEDGGSADREALRRAIEEVRRRIIDACVRVSRDPDEVRIVAVTKMVPVGRIRIASEAGLTTFGENRVQEALGKVGEVPGARWHLVGPLQSNKARRALATFDLIETVDSIDLARRLDRLALEHRPGTQYPILAQINVDVDPAKGGFAVDVLATVMDELVALPNVAVRGLMTVGRLVPTAEAARPTFVALRRASEELRGRWPALGPELSMGMTDDFEVAIEEGATIVRIGRAIFGERPA